MIFYCWYDNGTGWFEGTFVEEHETKDAAYAANDIGYGAYISTKDENPNNKENKNESRKFDAP